MMRMPALLSVLYLLTVPLMGVADLQAQTAGELDQFVEWGGTISLEETDDIIHVTPVLRIGPAGELIIADVREAQVRIHDRTGQLNKWIGRKGKGPGEYEGPVAAGKDSAGGL